jgi:heme exporter protein C
MVIISLFAIFVIAPKERVMGLVQKIFYYHVSAGWIGLFAFFILFIASILYLATRDEKWDIICHSTGRIGVLFTSIVLMTGPIWAKAVWNTWWTWDPRLTSTLLLWFLYVGYLKLRKFIGDNQNKMSYAAIFGIIAFIDVPIVFFSIRWWQSIHPVLFTGTGFNMSRAMLPAFFTSLLAFTLLFLFMLDYDMKLERLRRDVEGLKKDLLF